ncbi:MAG: DUF2202 domain-containing protein [Bacteroidales bacterium]|nr:DUF2202 domain-containing protein [Bacteroidales bacterium]
MKSLKERKPATFLGALFVLLATGFFFTSSAKINPGESGSLPLSAEDSISLMQMREEEKMARDVYLGLSELYGLNIFANISSSEQVHMDEVLRIIEANGLSDPASTERGVFRNREIQKLYDDLMEKGKKSLTDALLVGAAIEDVDIYDLQNFMARTKNKEIYAVFSFLNCGSRNHLRAFTFQLNRFGVNYIPVHISDEEYAAIINRRHEPCGALY